MTEIKQDFIMTEGNSKILRCDSGVQDEDNGGVVSISGDELTWVLAPYEGANPLVTKTTGGGGVTITDGANGKFEVELLPSDTDGEVSTEAKDFFHQAQLQDAYDSEIARGTVTIRPTSIES